MDIFFQPNTNFLYISFLLVDNCVLKLLCQHVSLSPSHACSSLQNSEQEGSGIICCCCNSTQKSKQTLKKHVTTHAEDWLALTEPIVNFWFAWDEEQLCFRQARHHCWSCEYCCVIPCEAVVGAADPSEAACWWDLLCSPSCGFLRPTREPSRELYCVREGGYILCSCVIHMNFILKKNQVTTPPRYPEGNLKTNLKIWAASVEWILCFLPPSCWIVSKGLEAFTYWTTRQQRKFAVIVES